MNFTNSSTQVTNLTIFFLAYPRVNLIEQVQFSLVFSINATCFNWYSTCTLMVKRKTGYVLGYIVR